MNNKKCERSKHKRQTRKEIQHTTLGELGRKF